MLNLFCKNEIIMVNAASIDVRETSQTIPKHDPIPEKNHD